MNKIMKKIPLKRLIGNGAEARIYRERSKVIKHRQAKSYRIRELDDSIRRSRTKREAKFIQKLRLLGIDAPKLIKVDENSMEIVMEYVDGQLLKDIFDKNYAKYSKSLGEIIAKLHDNDMIHGDLTTSNMILRSGRIFLIDFGLSFFSKKIEDKAVDLHLLKQALESKHWKVFDKAFKIIFDTYRKKSWNGEATVSRLKEVELRGRYKHKH